MKVLPCVTVGEQFFNLEKIWGARASPVPSAPTALNGSAATAVYPQQSLLGPRVNSNPLPLFFFQSKCAEIGVCFNSISTSFFFFCLKSMVLCIVPEVQIKISNTCKIVFSQIWLLCMGNSDENGYKLYRFYLINTQIQNSH